MVIAAKTRGELEGRAKHIFSLGVRGSSVKYHYVQVGDRMWCLASTGNKAPVVLGSITTEGSTAGTWAEK